MSSACQTRLICSPGSGVTAEHHTHARFPRDSYARDPESPKRENLLTTRRKTFLGAKWRRFIASLAMDGNASALNASRQGPSCQCQSMKLFERCRIIPKRWMEVVCPQCTMGKLKNGVKRSQVWQIISPSIFNQNLSNFERWCLNSQKSFKTIYLPNITKKIFLDSKKPVGGICASQDWSQTIPLKKSKMFYKMNILRKHPQVA